MEFNASQLLFIAGPCMLESSALSLEIAAELVRLNQKFPELQMVYKGSFDKANRTSLKSERGPGLEQGLKVLAEVGDRYGLPTLTDIHHPDQARPAAEVCTVLQIPAFLCRQTDLLVAAARTGRVVNVKKGQFLSPGEMRYVVEKLEQSKVSEIWLTERGTTFGYQDLVVDMRSFPRMKALGWPVIMDATHAVQSPGAGGGKTSGHREYIPTLALAALAAGADGLFVETHPNPAAALSDGPNQVPLGELENLVKAACKIWEARR